MPELLLEILSEEIPARMQARAAEDLKRLVMAGLKDAGLAFSEANAYVTPRRLTLVVDGLPDKQPDVSEEKRGPKVDAPEQAVNGFKGSLPDGAVIEERETPKGTFFFATINRQGIASAKVLPGVLGRVLLEMPWPKSMIWASSKMRWVRPIHNILAVFKGLPLIGVVDLGSQKFLPSYLADETIDHYVGGRAMPFVKSTYGHRFLRPNMLEIDDFADYKQKLLAAKVMLDPADRSAKIEADAKALAEKHGVALKDDPSLLAEVTGLVEWPVVLIGTIEDQFMELPDEVLTTSMRSHQKYFSCINADGTLANKFIVVANTETADGGAQVVAGNERVLRARLSDAKFFWDQDRAQSLASRAPALKDRVFHAKLGTVDEKVDRMQALAGEIASHVPNADRDKVRSAARLAKADLSTGMVAEFPELQGLMGRYYALHDGEDAAVADAIAEHYSPLGPNDTCPTAPISICVAMADKIDSLVGFFAIDEKPTGSKDPFALRRAALGVIRLILENDLRMPLGPILKSAHAQIGQGDEPTRQLLDFFADRLKVYYRDRNLRFDVLDAVFAVTDDDDLCRVRRRVHALSAFLQGEDGKELKAAHKRASNILRIEEKKDGVTYSEPPDESKFSEDAEGALFMHLNDVGPEIESCVANEQYGDAMRLLAEMRSTIDLFFEKVTVNADDAALRVNRLKLLNGIRSALDAIADFSKIEG